MATLSGHVSLSGLDFDCEIASQSASRRTSRLPRRKKVPFVHSQSSASRGGGDQFVDYEQRYGPDDYGNEMGPNARVWRVYLDEADKYDVEMMSGFKDTTDVLLVFAGLFSAVVTTFVVSSSQALQPDYAQITAALLTEVIRLQRAVAQGLPVDSIPQSPLNLESDTSSLLDRWVNALWFTSLSFSLSSALIAVLVKQWLQHYTSNLSGTPRDRVLLRHFRFLGLTKWRVPFIVDLLPILLHVSLFMFFVGLALHIWPLNSMTTTATIVVSGSAYTLYVLTNLLALIFPDCAYKSPVAECFLHLLKAVQRTYTSFRLHRPQHTREYDQKTEHFHARKDMDTILASALIWLSSASSNPTGSTIVTQAIAGIPFNFTANHILQQSTIRNSVERELVACFDTNTDTLIPARTNRAETLSRALTVTGTNLPEASCHARIQQIESAFFQNAHPRRLAVKAISAVTFKYYSKMTRNYSIGIVYETLFKLVVEQVELPPSLWERLFYMLLECSSLEATSLDVTHHHRLDFHYTDGLGAHHVHHTCFQLVRVLITLVRTLCSSERIGTQVALDGDNANWALPPELSLSVLCQREPRMRLLVLKFLSCYGLPQLGIRPRQDSPQLVLERCDEVLIHSLRFSLSVLHRHQEIDIDSAILLSLEQTLHTLQARYPNSSSRGVLIDAIHRLGEFGCQVEPDERAIPRLIRLLDVTECSMYAPPMISTSSLAVLTTYYIQDVLSHPWPVLKTSLFEDTDAGIVFHRLFSIASNVVYETFRELRGLAVFKRCFPVDFSSESIWMQSFHTWTSRAFQHYVHHVTATDTESCMDELSRREHLADLVQPENLSWLMWLELLVANSPSFGELVQALLDCHRDPENWRSAARMLVDALHRDAALYGTWNTTPSSGSWIPTLGYRGLEDILRRVGIDASEECYALYRYVTIPHFEEQALGERLELELRIDGELVNGPYALRYIDPASLAPEDTSSVWSMEVEDKEWVVDTVPALPLQLLDRPT